MTSPSIGLALYTIRHLEQTLPEMIHTAAEMGYECVELVHSIHTDFDVDAVNEAFEETGLFAVGVHVWLHDLEDEMPKLVDQYPAIGCDTFIIPYHPDTNLQTEARLASLVERLTVVGNQLEDQGCHLLYHPNHWDMIPVFDGPVSGKIPSLRLSDKVATDSTAMTQFRRVEDELIRRRNRLFDQLFIAIGATDYNHIKKLENDSPMAYIIDHTSPDVMNFEIDVSFFIQQGYDPAEVIDFFGDRVTHIHAKDIDTSGYRPGVWCTFVDAGEGETDFQAVMDAAERNGVEWVLFENGHATDPMYSIARGIEVLRECRGDAIESPVTTADSPVDIPVQND